MRFVISFAVVAAGFVQAADPGNEFATSIRPVLMQNCAACHNPAAAKGPAPFLKTTDLSGIDANRGLWRNVAAQLRNRTMPPRDSKLSEDDRLRVATWIDSRLRQTACSTSTGEYAGRAITRRLNRREYHNTIRDLLGIDYEVSAILPNDGTGGAGFDTNGETLYIPPVLTERYMEAAQQILDRVIVTTPLIRSFESREAAIPVYLDSAYDVTATFGGSGNEQGKFSLSVDGTEVGTLRVQRRGTGPLLGRLQVNLNRGSHTLMINLPDASFKVMKLNVAQKADAVAPERRASHYRLFGMEPGDQPAQPRKAAQLLLEAFLPRAFRRPVTQAEIDRFMTLYDRAAERGDPYEERVKLVLKAVLVWPDFLFRVEQKHADPGLYPLSNYELATRLSYFLWSTVPDEKLVRLAEEGRLQNREVLLAQVDRMLDDPRSRTFLNSFVGQWLGTQEVGGRVVPLLTELQSFYTPEVAADLRAQPVLLMDRILGEDRSLLELLTADYTHLTQRLARFYQIEDKVTGLNDGEFKLVQWPDNRRSGILGLGGVLAMSSRYKETSPVLRGAWVLESYERI